MTAYKRNQIEEAISRTANPQSGKLSSELRTRLKRLLDTDRNLGRNERSADPERANYAFYSSESPGKGVEIRFSDYEAFALLIGLRLLQHGWPQGFAVAILRCVRAELERQHNRILKQDLKTLFDQQKIRQRALSGELYVTNTDPVFLTIASRRGDDAGGNDEVPLGRICRGMKQVAEFLKEVNASSWTLFELATPAHELRDHLLAARPRKRGRGA